MRELKNHTRIVYLKERFHMGSWFFLVISLLVLIFSLILSNTIKVVNQKKQALNELIDDPEKALAYATDVTVQKVAKLTSLPRGTPVLIKVPSGVDMSKNPHFPRALADDRILIYREEGRAIIYRPITNTIVDIVKLELSDPVVGMISIEYRAPSLDEEKVKSIADKLYQQASNSQIVKKNISSTQTDRFLVFDNTRALATAAAQLADIIKGEVITDLPSGEAPTDSAFLLIGP